MSRILLRLGAAVLGAAVAVGVPGTVPAMTDDARSQRAESMRVPIGDGLTLHALLRRSGSDGVPFLFVHGLASNARLWDEVAALVSAGGHDSVAVDQRGHGLSSQTDEGYDFATLVGDLEAAIEATVEAPVIAVGQSWGANVVLELAAQRPETVIGLGLVDGGFIRLRDAFAFWEEVRSRLAPPSFDHVTKLGLQVMMRESPAGFSDTAVAAQMANFEEAADGTLKARLRRHNHMSILRHLWMHDPDMTVRSLEIPIRLLAVKGDGPAQPDRVDAFAAAAGAITIHWLDGHHDIHAQQPQVVADILLDLAREAGS